MRAPAARSAGAAGVSHNSPRAQTCTFQGPGLQKHHQNSTRIHPEREEKNEFCGGRGKKKSEILGGPAEGGPGKGSPGKGGPGKGGPGKGGPGKGGPGGTEHDQTKTLKHTETVKPTHTTHTHTNTHTNKHTQTNTHKHKHTHTHTQTHTNTNRSRFWPKSVLAKVGHTTKTPTLAKVGLAKVGHDHFDVDKLLKNLREARKGSAAGPSGITSEHLKPLLESAECSRLFGEVSTQFARGEMPEEILKGIKMGRMTALQKHDGGVHGIVVGDVVRRLVARTIAQQFTEEAEAVTHLFQYALSTRVGTECVAHVVQSLTSMDSNTTILSIDGVGAHDFISRRAMFQGVADLPNGDQLIPFIRQFDEEPSTFVWEDKGEAHNPPR